MNRRERRDALLWLAPTLGTALVSLVFPPGGLVWALAIGAMVLSGANVALHLDSMSRNDSEAS